MVVLIQISKLLSRCGKLYWCETACIWYSRLVYCRNHAEPFNWPVWPSVHGNGFCSEALLIISNKTWFFNAIWSSPWTHSVASLVSNRITAHLIRIKRKAWHSSGFASVEQQIWEHQLVWLVTTTDEMRESNNDCLTRWHTTLVGSGSFLSAT